VIFDFLTQLMVIFRWLRWAGCCLLIIAATVFWMWIRYHWCQFWNLVIVRN